ncbi:MAG: hypothetical protein WBG92_05555 [Thiohalocapsa sp.]
MNQPLKLTGLFQILPWLMLFAGIGLTACMEENNAASPNAIVPEGVPEGTQGIITIGKEGTMESIQVFAPDGTMAERCLICTPEQEEKFGTGCEKATEHDRVCESHDLGEPSIDTTFQFYPGKPETSAASVLLPKPAFAGHGRCIRINGFNFCY